MAIRLITAAAGALFLAACGGTAPGTRPPGSTGYEVTAVNCTCPIEPPTNVASP